MKKNIILESYNDLFLAEKPIDRTHLTHEYIEELVNSAIDDEFPDRLVHIAGYNLTPSECLKKCDPIAYNEYFLNYCDAMNFDENDDGTYYDKNAQNLEDTNIDDDDLMKECCHCCGNEFLRQELDPETGYCLACQEDELLNGPKEFRPDEDDDAVTIIIKESAMKRWKKCHTTKKVKKNKK